MIPDVSPSQTITASHINRIKRAATRKHTGDGVFETGDFIVHRKIESAGVATGMRFVGAAGEIPGEDQLVGVYPLVRNDDEFSIDLDNDGLPNETEVMNVWPHMRSRDFFPLFIKTENPRDYDQAGLLFRSATVCPAYLVDGEWWLHNTVRMAWATPDPGAVFTSCGSRIDGVQP